jgi:hypothetical protein
MSYKPLPPMMPIVIMVLVIVSGFGIRDSGFGIRGPTGSNADAIRDSAPKPSESAV